MLEILSRFFSNPFQIKPQIIPTPSQIKPQIKPPIIPKRDFEPVRIGGNHISDIPTAIYSKSKRPNHPSVLKADVEGPGRAGTNGGEGGEEGSEWPNSE